MQAGLDSVSLVAIRLLPPLMALMSGRSLCREAGRFTSSRDVRTSFEVVSQINQWMLLSNTD